MPTPKVFLYISMSLDGFIATEDDDLSWLDAMMVEGEDYNYGEIMARTGSYVVGRKTYDKVVEMVGEFPQRKNFPCYVITRQKLLNEDNLTFHGGDVEALVNRLKKEGRGDIYCDGGSQVVKLFMEADLIDEYIISIVPALLGSGKRLFSGGATPGSIRLIKQEHFKSGLVQLRYERLKKQL
ncbi:dihydrofolate reductase family protein [Neolewinella agarilytica]|uniref:dihydrofolate reductase family protein n=1 Tax=Neolewinella agarilytica TaxID=478744 RepID=UPI00235668BD|nr:dihydrofolate reductase family protein [Neolewinella agarilytica]